VEKRLNISKNGGQKHVCGPFSGLSTVMTIVWIEIHCGSSTGRTREGTDEFSGDEEES
jgi:hypothetical protein